MKKTTILGAFAAALPLALAPLVLAQHEHGHETHGQTGQHGAQHGTSAGGHAMGMRGMEALNRLSGRAFSVAFLSQMIEHHQGAVDMSRKALPSLKNARVRKHAQQIIADQNKEIRQMTALLQKTYNTKPSAAQRNLMKQDMQGMMAMDARGDRMFLQMMIPHHQGAIDMSKLALKKSENAAVKRLASAIIKAQTREIAEFQRLLQGGTLAAASR